MKYIRLSFVLLVAWATITSTKAQKKEGILTDEFIFEKAPFPESHASTIAETPVGLVTAWFGGTKERNPDVGIWVSRSVSGKWTAPVEVSNGIVNDTLRYACWNPVLYQIPKGDLLLFYKVGPNVPKWKGYMLTSKDNGKSWSKPHALPDGFLGPIKNKPVLLSNGELWCPSSMEGDGWKVHFEVTSDFGKTWRKVGPLNDGKIGQRHSAKSCLLMLMAICRFSAAARAARSSNRGLPTMAGNVVGGEGLVLAQ
jgi:predicted neuraminidase